MRIDDPSELLNPTYPNEWFIVASVVILLVIWFGGPLLRLVDRLKK